jgi:hypothetical protein
LHDLHDIDKRGHEMAFETKLSRRFLTKMTIATAAVPVTRSVMAQDAATPVGDLATPEPGGLSGLPEGATLVAEGLFNPRFIALGDDGTLYVTEQGVGGDEVISPPATGVSEATPDAEAGATPVVGLEEATPVAEGPPSTRGYTGQLSMIATDGTQTVLVEGLPSYSDGVGPHGIALGAGEVYYAIGGMGVGLGIDPLPEENTVNRFVLDTGEASLIADIGAYEVENNPDGADVNPNLYMMDHGPLGNLVVADAGGNTIYNVAIETGEFELAGVVPTLTEVSGVEPTQDMGSGQPVPTSVVIDQAGIVNVGVLREAWPEDAPSVFTMEEDGTFTPVELEGSLSWTVAMAVGPDGLLYASQLFGEFTEQGPGPGRVVRITAEGTVESVVENVMMPHGLTFDDEGNLYLAINTMMSGPGMPAGQIIRLDGVGAAIG